MKTKKIIDLSFELSDGMITYPTNSHLPFESSIVGRIEIEGRETRKFTMGSHCGTHIDAPKHFIKGAKSITDIELSKLIGEANLIDLGKLPPKTEINKEIIEKKILKISNNHGKILFRTHWSRFWNTNQYYKDWPSFTEEAAKFLCDQKLHLIGLDFPSPDKDCFGIQCKEDSPNHKLFFSKEIILAEYLNNLDKLNEGIIFLMVSPLKLKNFDGGPSRVTAFNL